MQDLLKWVCWKRQVYFAKVDHRGTSQMCPNCGAHTGKKDLSVRTHHCPECGYTVDRDVAAALVIRAGGVELIAVGQTVSEIACGGDASGTIRNLALGGTRRSRKPKG
ncbi:MAG: transposase [Scytonema hyalinum WJT4-NPBG1]|nr:transposase [Scytonema hyalinum WJT4-NPBG1]